MVAPECFGGVGLAGRAGEDQLHQVGLVGGDLDAEVRVGPEPLDEAHQLIKRVARASSVTVGFRRSTIGSSTAEGLR